MAKIDNNKIVLTIEETKLLKDLKEFELVPNQKGIFLLIDKKVALEKEGAQVCVSVPMVEAHEEVLNIIRKSNLSDLVEGKFEKKLDDKQKKALLELTVSGKVFVFKLNDSYKKGIYRIKEKDIVRKESEKFIEEKKALPDYNLEIDGFVATTNTERAKALSTEYREQIEKNLLKGIKSFEGIYYLVETSLIDKHFEKILKIIREKKEVFLKDIAREENISTELTKIIIEFLKEEGEILEKKKGQYKFIE